MIDLTMPDIREAFNAAIFISAPAMSLVLIRHIYAELRQVSKSFESAPSGFIKYMYRKICHIYRSVDWVTKTSMGWLCVCIGETIRGGVAWWLIHNKVNELEITNDVLPAYILVLLGLFLVIVGFLCAIRQLTPEHWGRHSIWIPTFLTISVLVPVVLIFW